MINNGTGIPSEPGLYCAMVRGGWKILEWSEISGSWHYPGMDIDWLPEFISVWHGPLQAENDSRPAQVFDL